MTSRRLLLAMIALALAASSCAYYNTFYLARKYYFRATEGKPYVVERQTGQQSQNYSKAIEYSKKILGVYEDSKWVDDAYLLWARALIGRDDPLQTVSMLQDFSVRYPKSPLRAEATFYLGLAYRNARRHAQAVAEFDEFLAQAPKHELAPYAYLERARALVSLQRYAEAAASAGEVLSRYPRHSLVDQARTERAEARFQQGDHAGAREDYRVLGSRALTDDERFRLLLREVDCLEAAHAFDDELELLRRERAGLPPPVAIQPGQLPPAGADRYGRLSLRIGGVHLLRGELDLGLAEYLAVIQDYPKSLLSSEAQYRVAYAFETVGEDFDRARTEYNAVKDQSAGSPFVAQATQRLANLDRIAQYRAGAGADSTELKAEAAFLTAELYLFQLDRPERALEEYRRVEREYPGTAVAARALTAEGWVLSRKLDKPDVADSLFWRVVREYPATEAQLAARDYLEERGHEVPASLIVLPKPKPVPRPDTTLAAPAPVQSRADSIRMANDERMPRVRGIISVGSAAMLDSLRRAGQLPPGMQPPDEAARGPRGMFGSPPDTTHAPSPPPAPPDSTGERGAPSAPADSTQAPGTP